MKLDKAFLEKTDENIGEIQTIVCIGVVCCQIEVGGRALIDGEAVGHCNRGIVDRQHVDRDAALDRVGTSPVPAHRVHRLGGHAVDRPAAANPIKIEDLTLRDGHQSLFATRMRLDEASIATGLLHDTVEDTLATLDELKGLNPEALTAARSAVGPGVVLGPQSLVEAGASVESVLEPGDAAVYGVALYAVGHSAQMKLRAAHFSGWLQVILALGALSEVVRRFLYGSEPDSNLMMLFGLVALAANVLCLALITKHREGGVHMKASWIFSANDVIANLGIIIAGALVAWTGSRYPDLIIGFIIAGVVLNGAYRILKLRS